MDQSARKVPLFNQKSMFINGKVVTREIISDNHLSSFYDFFSLLKVLDE